MKKVFDDGDVEYRNSNGKLHRTDGPAVEYADGDKYWFINDKLLARMIDGTVTILTKGKLPSLIKQSIAMKN